MLDRLDPLGAASERRRVVGVDHAFRGGRDGLTARNTKKDAGIGRAGAEREPDRLAGMNPDAIDRHRAPKSRLSVHGARSMATPMPAAEIPGNSALPRASGRVAALR